MNIQAVITISERLDVPGIYTYPRSLRLYVGLLDISRQAWAKGSQKAPQGTGDDLFRLHHKYYYVRKELRDAR